MNTDRFTSILKHQETIGHIDTVELKSIVEKFPYFQAARALYLKGLKNKDSFKYNNELKLTAAYTSDRTVLFDFITSNNFNTQKEGIHKQISNKILAETKNTFAAEKVSHTKTDDNAKIINQSTQETKKLQLGTPISFNSTESYSFNEWLKLSTKKPIERSKTEKLVTKTIKPTSKKVALINRFIEENPKIEPLPKGKNITIPIKENKQDAALMTETLAKVYLEQKKYESAVQAYRILSLKYPEKSGFFADQIKRVQILQKNKL